MVRSSQPQRNGGEETLIFTCYLSLSCCTCYSPLSNNIQVCYWWECDQSCHRRWNILQEWLKASVRTNQPKIKLLKLFSANQRLRVKQCFMLMILWQFISTLVLSLGVNSMLYMQHGCHTGRHIQGPGRHHSCASGKCCPAQCEGMRKHFTDHRDEWDDKLLSKLVMTVMCLSQHGSERQSRCTSHSIKLYCKV